MDKTRLIGQGIMAGSALTHSKELDFTHLGDNLKGTFVFKRPTVLEQMNIGVLKNEMLQGQPEQTHDVYSANIAHMTATLTFVLKNFPEWFRINEIYDYEILDTVYEEYAKWLDTFRQKGRQANS